MTEFSGKDIGCNRMIVILKKNYDKIQLDGLLKWLNSKGITAETIHDDTKTVLGLVGNTSELDSDTVASFEVVESVKSLREPYKQASRREHPRDTVIDIWNTRIGGGALSVIAGPCTVESEQQLLKVAQRVKESGATALRGGAFKPRTSPYSFRGLGEEGLRFLVEARELTGLPVISEIMDISQLPLFENIDIIQVGARNMQNYYLLSELGAQDKPVMLKRGQGATYEEWLMSAEYIMKGGNENVILCERGIRTFEGYTRNTLDISSIPVIKELSHLPIIVDPSHSAGYAAYVPSLSMAAVAAGADGLIIEVHNNPAQALCDGKQSLDTEQFAALADRLFSLHGFLQSEDRA